MNLSHAYGPPQPRDVAERMIRARARAGRHAFRHRGAVRLRRQRAAGGRRARQAPRQRHRRQQVRAVRPRRQTRDGRPARSHPRRLRAVAAQPARPTASISTTCIAGTSAFPSKTRSARWRTWCAPARSARSGSPKSAPRRCAARTPCIPSWRCSPNTRCGRAIRKSRCSRSAGASARRSWHSARWAAGILDRRAARSGRVRRRRPAARHAALPESEFRGKPAVCSAPLDEIAASAGCTRAQLALAWVLAGRPTRW